MPYPALQTYLSRLPATGQSDARLSVDGHGQAQGRFFNCTLTSAFQPIRSLDTRHVIGYEAFARSYSPQGDGLSPWRLLDQAASDDESVELDRLCRMLHAMNYFRQAGGQCKDLYLSVHDRLLTAIGSNHGMAFRRILDTLELPHQRIVLQLPPVSPNQGWLLTYVSANYRLNGFHFAVSARNIGEARQMLGQVKPDAIKLDIGNCDDVALSVPLLLEAREAGVPVVFKRVDSQASLAALHKLQTERQVTVHVQGRLIDLPSVVLSDFADPGTPFPEDGHAACRRTA